MNFNEVGILQQKKFSIKNLLPEIGIDQVRKEIIQGLTAEKPYIPSKFFYDEKGSQLFEEITRLPEYYPTRTEKKILSRIASELMNRKSNFEIIELGSGDSSKISILLDAVQKNNLKNLKYTPVDFSQSAIKDSASILAESFPELEIEGFVADFIHQIDLIPHSNAARLVCFLGSTIGNFTKNESVEILNNISAGLFKGDSVLIGFDLVKPKNILNLAYNDSQGITEEFNKNILHVVNKIIGADFDIDWFEHLAFFNEQKARIEMHLVANQNCTISLKHSGKKLHFSKGDSLHTENSHKFTFSSIEEIVAESGLKINNIFTDEKRWFALAELIPVN
jgi:L-histidine N-alpha-methyltransferase